MKLHWGDIQIGDASQNASSFLPFPSLNLHCRVMLCQLQPSTHPLTDTQIHTHTVAQQCTHAQERMNAQTPVGGQLACLVVFAVVKDFPA